MAKESKLSTRRSLLFMRRLALLAVLVACGVQAGTRPYEFDWANRTADDRPVLMRLERADGWTVGTTDAVATLTTGVERVLFGDGVMHLDYRGTGKRPAVRLTPPEPVALPPGADTVSLWVWGNNVSYRRDKSTPPVTLTLPVACTPPPILSAVLPTMRPPFIAKLPPSKT